MLLTYKGRHTEGVSIVLEPGGAEVFVAHGDTVEVPEDLAGRLIEEQPDAFSKSTRKTPTTPTSEEE